MGARTDVPAGEPQAALASVVGNSTVDSDHLQHHRDHRCVHLWAVSLRGKDGKDIQAVWERAGYVPGVLWVADCLRRTADRWDLADRMELLREAGAVYGCEGGAGGVYGGLHHAQDHKVRGLVPTLSWDRGAGDPTDDCGG